MTSTLPLTSSQKLIGVSNRRATAIPRIRNYKTQKITLVEDDGLSVEGVPLKELTFENDENKVYPLRSSRVLSATSSF